jgi:integrase
MPRGTKAGSITKKRVTRYINGRRKLIDIWEVRKRFDSPIAVNYRRVAYSADQATKTMRAIEKDFADKIAKLADPDPEQRTFADLSKHFETNYLKPPVWHDGRKVEGMRSYQKRQSTLKFLREAFGDRLLRDIGWAELAELKSERLRSPVVTRHRSSPRKAAAEYDLITRQRSMASVQEPLKLASRMFNVAVRLGWMTHNPFTRGDALIILAHEKKRSRILSSEEEERLRSVCNRWLWDLVTIAVDTAFRESEMLSLAVDDVYLEQRLIRLRAENSKTEKERMVPITARMMPILKRSIAESADGRVFPAGTREYIDRHFRPALRLANVRDFQWRDLRHTATTRMVSILKNPIRVMKITGHTNYKTFIEVYVNVDEEIVLEMADALDAAHALLTETPPELNEETVN